MKKLIILLFVLFSFSAFAQKELQETTEFCRIHKITSFSEGVDSLTNEVIYYADFTIYREGVDGKYNLEIPKKYYKENDNCIEYVAKLPEYVNFTIINE